MVRIRLKRTGRRHKPSFRLTAVDVRNSRDGRVLEELGYYNPAHKNPAMQCNVKTERIEYWLGVGAQPSKTVKDLLAKTGVQGLAAKSES